MRIGVLLVVMALMFSCDNSENNPNTVEVDFVFEHTVDSEPVIFDQIVYKNVLNQEFSIKTIKYFITRIQMHRSDGSTVVFSNEFYVDARDTERLIQGLGSKIPKGEYSGISFIHGLVPEDNITGKYTQSPESLMEWPVPMGGGYHYIKLEGESRVDQTTSFYNFHSGMLNETAYEIHIDLNDQNFSVNSDKISIRLTMEIQNWFSGPNDWNFVYYGPGIMGNPEAQEVVKENGHNVYSFEVVNETIE